MEDIWDNDRTFRSLVVEDIYEEFFIGKGKIKDIADVIKDGNHIKGSMAQRTIYKFAANPTYCVDPLIIAIYVIALKHDCLRLFENVAELSETVIEGLLPYDVKHICGYDVKPIVDFYNRYGKKSLNHCKNKIKFPIDFKI